MDALEDIYALCRRNNIWLVPYCAPTASARCRLEQADRAQFDGREGVSTLNCSDYTAQIAADPESDFYDSIALLTVLVRGEIQVRFSRTDEEQSLDLEAMNCRIPCCGWHARISVI